MDLVGYVSESFMDADKRIQDRLLQRKRRKIRRGEKMSKIDQKLDPMQRIEKLVHRD